MKDNKSSVVPSPYIHDHVYDDAVPHGLPKIPDSLFTKCAEAIEGGFRNSITKDVIKEFYKEFKTTKDNDKLWNKVKSVLTRDNFALGKEEFFATELLRNKMSDEDVLKVVNHVFKKEADFDLQIAKQHFLSGFIEKNDIEGVKTAFSAGAKIDNGRLKEDTPKDTGDVLASRCSSDFLFIDSSSLYLALSYECNKEIVGLLIDKGADFKYILDEARKYPKYFPLSEEKLKTLREVVKEKNIDLPAIQDADHTRTSHAENEKVISQESQTTPNNKIEPTNKTTQLDPSNKSYTIS